VVLTAAVTGLAMLAVTSVATGVIGVGARIGQPAPGIEAPQDAWNPNPDFVVAARRLPRTPDHPELWANPFHEAALPADFPMIGGQEFTIRGDGNPRLLVAGADPRVITGPDNPQFNEANYASSGVAFGSGAFHRLLIDTPPPGSSHRVQIDVGGKTIEYRFDNTPY
jgi:hypothetical protein